RYLRNSSISRKSSASRGIPSKLTIVPSLRCPWTAQVSFISASNSSGFLPKATVILLQLQRAPASLLASLVISPRIFARRCSRLLAVRFLEFDGDSMLPCLGVVGVDLAQAFQHEPAFLGKVGRDL